MNYKDRFDAMPINQLLGITLVEQLPGYGRIQLIINEDTPEGIGGSVNGGVLATMVDMSMLVAVFSSLSENEKPAGTAELNISYLRQAHGKKIFATAREIKRGRQLVVCDVDITDDNDRLCAKARATYAFRVLR